MENIILPRPQKHNTTQEDKLTGQLLHTEVFVNGELAGTWTGG